MIILSLRCGLGNQLFEYAFAFSLMKEFEEAKIYIDSYGFKKDKDGRSNSLKHFNIPDNMEEISGLKSTFVYYFFKIKAKVIKEYANFRKKDKFEIWRKCGIFDTNFEYYKVDFNENKKIKYLRGIFQNYHYFDSIKEELNKMYRVKTPPSNENKVILDKIIKFNSVCVHIRRGDYVNNERWSKELLVCTKEYYEKGMEYINQQVGDAKFFIFSNSHEDIEWIKENYKFEYEVEYVDMNNPDYEDFRLMYSCKHFVISNSSFSLWAQYLALNDDKIVVAPEYWDTGKNRYEGIYMKNWKIIELN